MDKISVLIVDNHALVRQGLRSLLELQPEIEVIGEAGDGSAAVAQTAKLVPDVVLMDLRMPGVDGISATRQIRSISPSTKVVVLTVVEEIGDAVKAINAGALSYLLKDVEPADLVRSIRDAAQGNPSMAPAVAREILKQLSNPAKPSSDWGLTEREFEVVGLNARGFSNRQIADELYISEKTVKTHVSNVLGKLHLRDRTQLAIWTHEQGLALKGEVGR